MASTRTKAVEKVMDAITFEKVWANADWARDILENHNGTNRPVTVAIWKRWRERILTGDWTPVPDTAGFDTDGNLISGQHRLIALVAAEQIRLEDPDLIKNVYGIDKPIEIPMLVTRGFLPKHADNTDIGKTRTSADVLARRHLFGPDNSDAVNKKLHIELAVAARLMWTRINGKTVKGSGVFAHHELKAFVEDHKELVDCLKFVRDLDAGDKNDRLICNYITLGYAAGLLSLMMSANSEKAEEFWTLFAAGGLTPAHPISRLKSYYLDQKQEGTRDRDHVVNAAIKAWNLFMTGKEEVTKANIKPKKDERVLIEDSLDGSEAASSESKIKAELDAKKPSIKPIPVDPSVNEPPDHMKPMFGVGTEKTAEAVAVPVQKTPVKRDASRTKAAKTQQFAVGYGAEPDVVDTDSGTIPMSGREITKTIPKAARKIKPVKTIAE